MNQSKRKIKMENSYFVDTRKKNEFLPDHAELLSARDLEEYQNMRQRFFADTGKSKKGERLESFIHKLQRIREYTEKGNNNDWKRSVVCGIFFLRNSIGINIQSLRTLLGKCKSSINGSLKQSGYIAQAQTPEFEDELASKIPLANRGMYDLKKWTMRVLETKKADDIEVVVAEEKPFIIEIPPPKIPKEVQVVKKTIERNFPCPVKCRYKYLELIQFIKPQASA